MSSSVTAPAGAPAAPPPSPAAMVLGGLSIRRALGMLALVLATLVGGTWMAVKFTTDELLYSDATATARNWVQYLTASVTDLEQIAAGELPSAASMAFFDIARKSGEVFRYEIFNRFGYSQIVSDRQRVALVDLAEFNADAARSVRIGRPVVDAREGKVTGQPAYFAAAFVPVLIDGRAIAVVAAYVDETARRDRLHHSFLLAAASLCLLTGLSFTLPAIAWYRRTEEKQRADRRIRFLAHHDALTGLMNRGRLIERLTTALAESTSPGFGLAVHFLDCDRFKEVNDTLGHDGGDFLLRTVAERLRQTTRAEDLIARLGGDEFIVVQTDVTGRGEAEALAQRLAAALAMPVRFKEHEIVTSASIGIAFGPEDGQTPERLLKSADLALYPAKADGRNCIRSFTPDLDAELAARLQLEAILRDAVRYGKFELHYQPLFRIADRVLLGFEALIRLRRADGTLIAPADFIPLAESMRLIDQIGVWVLREACRTAATWPAHLTVAVNLSPAQFATSSISAAVAAIIAETRFDPRRLELEITETLMLGDSEAIMLELRALKAMGIAIVMDDFGTGFSSLSSLWRFPFDKIKLDRSFMQGCDSSGRDAETIVKTIVALGREMRMQVTIEGVETAQQAAFLTETDSDQVQGYFFGRPAPDSELGIFIEPPPIAAPQRFDIPAA